MEQRRSLLSIATLAAGLLALCGSLHAGKAEAQAACPFSGIYQYNPASPTTNRCPSFTYISTQQAPGPGNSCVPIFICRNPQTGVDCTQAMTAPTLSCSGGSNAGCRTCVYDAMCGSVWSNTMAGVICGSPGVCNGSGACAACTTTNDPVCNDNNPCTTDVCSNPNTGAAACTRTNLASGTVCRAANGACDRQEVCPGGGANCPADTYQPSTYTCRASATGDACDPAETCTGSSTTCPANNVAPAGTICRAEAPGGCDVAEVCAGGGAACPANAFRLSTHVCRAAANATCDIAETCTGSSATCPPDTVQPNTVQCRASAGICDVAEMCSGGTCPADARQPNTFVCRASATGDLCDPAETCNGGTTCPVNTTAPAGTTCRAAAPGGCDIAEVCAGGGAACPANAFQPSTFVCRAAANATCDIAELCPGNSATCPPNVTQPNTTICRASAGICDVAETCNAGNCPADGLQPNTFVCRASATGDACDPAETCTGSSTTCPANNVAPAGTTCRAAAPGGCDIAEVCAGGGAACPANAFQPSTFVCRAAVNATCDIAETCPGNSATCPANATQPNTTVCRASAGICDVAETCNAGNCPADALRPNTFECRASATGDACDPAENCTGSSTTCPANSVAPSGTTCRAAAAGGCDVAEVCAGGGAACPANAFQPSTFVCRAAVNATCDVAETCPGNSATCPPNTVQPNTVQCRASAGDCDVPEMCSGGTCPANALRPSTHVCRASATGDACDPAENCSGSSATCPANTLAAAGATCRAAAGGCDVAEVCAGGGAACPANVLRASGFVCRAAANTCDVAETCNGTTASCPTDVLAAQGTSCGTGQICCLGTATACTGGALTCSSGCRTSADCPSPQYCTAGFVCATPACVTNADCTEGGTDNPCTTNVCSGSGATASCVYTPQALTTRTCLVGSAPFAPGASAPNGFCQIASGSPVCVECLSTSDCTGSDYCLNNECVAPACTTNADCTEGGTDNVCTTNTCVGVGAAAACVYTPIMSSTTSAPNCRRGAVPFAGTPDGFCVNNSGTPACIQCMDNGDCGAGQCCAAGACVTCQTCLSTSTTQSGTGGMCGNPPGAAGGNADSIFRYIPQGTASNDALQISYQLRAADVDFLLDTTLSMDGELSDLQAALTTGTIPQTCNPACATANGGIMGAIRCCVSGAYFGVATFDDYQVDPHGAPWPRRQTTYGTNITYGTTAQSPFGDDGDRVFWNRTVLTDPAGAAATRYTFVPRGVTSGTPSSAYYGRTVNANVTGQVHLSNIVNGLSLGQGGDIPEAQLVALNLLTVSDTTNNGVYAASSSNNDSTEYVVPAYARRTGNGTGVCDSANFWGYPCFRQGSIPVTVMMTDAPFHNGIQLPNGDAFATLFPVLGANYNTSGILYPSNLGSATGPLYSPPSWTTVVSNLLSREMRIITVESSDGRTCTSNADCQSTPPGCLPFVSGYESKCISGICRGPAYAHARALANATGSLDGFGAPYVNSISCQGTGMGASIVTQVAQLAQQERMDIWMDSVGAPAGLEVTFIPMTMSPVGGCQPVTGSTFPQCLPGTQTNFTVRIRNASLNPPSPVEYNFTVRLRGGSTRILKQVPVRIMVGPGQATYPEMGSYTQMFSQFTGESCTTDADCTTAGSGRFCVATATGARQCSRCSEGQRPSWGRLTWDSILPAGTRINFTIRTEDSSSATVASTTVWTSDGICASDQTCISSTSNVDAQEEMAAGTMAFPDDQGTFDMTRRLSMAGLASNRRYLQVTVGLYSSANRNAAPTLRNLGIEMNCIAAE